jgi:hypothetical protein
MAFLALNTFTFFEERLAGHMISDPKFFNPTNHKRRTDGAPFISPSLPHPHVLPAAFIPRPTGARRSVPLAATDHG